MVAFRESGVGLRRGARGVRGAVELALEGAARFGGGEGEGRRRRGVVPEGPPVMVVSGAVMSMVHVQVAGDASVLPTTSFARTWKVWDPTVRPV